LRAAPNPIVHLRRTPPFRTSEQKNQAGFQKKTGTWDRNGDYRASHKKDSCHKEQLPLKEFSRNTDWRHKRQLAHKKESTRFTLLLVSVVLLCARQFQRNGKFSGLFLVIGHMG
jgi:hypothetical protein